MGNFIDLTGQRFGELVVYKRAANIGVHVAWWCNCDCGKITVVQGGCLRAGTTKSCHRLQEQRDRYYKKKTPTKHHIPLPMRGKKRE